MHFGKYHLLLLTLIMGILVNTHAVPPVLNYAGQVTVNGEAFDGAGLFKFALVNADGTTTYWSNDGTSVDGSEPQASISVSVNGGLYAVLLGNTAQQGMGAIDPAIFTQHTYAKLRVWFSDGVNGFQQLSPDRPFASVPYAFSAGSAPIPQGSIDRSMLSNALRSDLNSSIKSITRDMLPDSVLADLNRTITRDMLPPSVLADLNRTITKSNLGSDILNDLNSSISLNRLSPEVLAALQISPSISTQPFARYDWKTDSATIQVSGRGHNLSYQWFRDGQPIDGATAPVLELGNPTLDDNATYSVRLTNSVGQTTSQNLTLQQAIGTPGLPLEEANATEIPRNGLVLWMDANDLNADGLADNLPTGTLINSWKSKVGDANASQFTELLKPKSNFFGDTNLKAVAFDGGDYLLDNNASLPVQHIFAVYRGNFDRNDIMLSNEANNLIQVYYDHGSSFLYGDFFKEDGGTIRVSGRDCPKYESHNYTTWKADLLITSAGSGGSYSGTFTKLGIGAKNANDNHWEGEFGEILFYDRALSNSERDAVERYLADKWSIQLHEDKIAAEQAAYDAATPPAEPNNGLLAYYKFEPVSVEPDKLWDYSGNNHHGILKNFNDGNPWVDGIDGKSIQFDGINDFVDLPSISGSHKSFTFWMRADFAINETESVVKVWSPKTDGPHFFSVNGGQHFKINNNHSSSSSLPNANFGKLSGWIHIALVYEEAYEFYLNGQKIDKTGNCPLFSGGAPHLGDYSYQGRLDEFRIYNRTLTPLEIQLLYAETNGEPILRTDIEHNASVGTAYSLSLNADNSPTTYFAQGLPPGLSLNVTTGAISGTPQSAGVYPVTIRASNEHGTSEDIIRLSVYPPSYEPPQGFSSIGEDDVPTNKLTLWLDANDVDADGQKDEPSSWQSWYGRYPKWSDKSSSNFDASQDLQTGAHYKENVLNGKSTFRFSSSQPGMLLGANYIFSFGAGEEDGLTIITVANSNDPQSNSSNRKLIDFGRGETGKAWGVTLRNNGGTFYTPTAHDGKSLDFTINKAPGDFSIGTFRVTFQQQQEVFIDGSLIASATTNLERLTNDEIASRAAPFGNGGPVVIGGHSLGVTGSALFGDIAELLVWKRALTDSERVVVEQYLAQKWGLQHQTYLPPLEQPEAGLLGRWTFDEGEGNLVHDVSGNKDHGTLAGTNDVDTWKDGPRGKSVKFDGFDDRFIINARFREQKSITFWFQSDFLGSSENPIRLLRSHIGGRHDETIWLNDFNSTIAGEIMGIRRDDGKLTYILEQDADIHEGWNHFAMTWDGGASKYLIFINGTEVNSHAGSVGHYSFTGSMNAQHIFAKQPEWGGNNHFAGKLDDFRIYSRSLTETEIKNICGDQDGDGLTDIREAELGTDPNLADTDGDGENDKEEVDGNASALDRYENSGNLSLKEGLGLHLKFDETSGTTAYDSSANQRNTALAGFSDSTSHWVQGKIGNALQLDGINDWGTTTSSLGQNFTVAFWIKTTDDVNKSGNAFVDNAAIGAFATNTYGFFLMNNKFEIWVGNMAQTYSPIRSNMEVNLGSWVHLAIARENSGHAASDVYLYINGNYDKKSGKNYLATGAVINIGKAHDGNKFYKGALDDFRVYGRKLSNSEIRELYYLGQ